MRSCVRALDYGGHFENFPFWEFWHCSQSNLAFRAEKKMVRSAPPYVVDCDTRVELLLARMGSLICREVSEGGDSGLASWVAFGILLTVVLGTVAGLFLIYYLNKVSLVHCIFSFLLVFRLVFLMQCIGFVGSGLTLLAKRFVFRNSGIVILILCCFLERLLRAEVPEAGGVFAGG